MDGSVQAHTRSFESGIGHTENPDTFYVFHPYAVAEWRDDKFGDSPSDWAFEVSPVDSEAVVVAGTTELQESAFWEIASLAIEPTWITRSTPDEFVFKTIVIKQGWNGIWGSGSKLPEPKRRQGFYPVIVASGGGNRLAIGGGKTGWISCKMSASLVSFQWQQLDSDDFRASLLQRGSKPTNLGLLRRASSGANKRSWWTLREGMFSNS
jgi:hypothetical protein